MISVYTVEPRVVLKFTKVECIKISRTLGQWDFSSGHIWVLNLATMELNVRETRSDNHKLTIQRNWQHWAHNKQDKDKQNTEN